jgi:four helix bundle suffix protein
MDKQYNEDGFIPKHGGYQNLITFQKAEIIFLGTNKFCEKWVNKFDRTYDQMIQSARSGQQNILEGSMASGTSKKTEIFLTNVARASLEELKKDYLNFLKVRNLVYWDKNHSYYQELSKKHRLPEQTYETFRKGIESDNPEVAANVLYSLANVTTYLLSKQLKKLEREFLDEGGLSERMSEARIEVRKKQK